MYCELCVSNLLCDIVRGVSGDQMERAWAVGRHCISPSVATNGRSVKLAADVQRLMAGRETAIYDNGDTAVWIGTWWKCKMHYWSVALCSAYKLTGAMYLCYPLLPIDLLKVPSG